jgi:hypothetical protein
MANRSDDIHSSSDFSKIALSISQVAALSGLGRTLIFQEIKAGRLIARKCGRRTIVLSADLQLWLEALPRNAPRVQAANGRSRDG